MQGFTLIELMIVVAVVAILAAIAYPSYTDSVKKGRRAQGRTAIVQMLQQQERYMTQHNVYSAVAAGNTTFTTYSGDNPTNPAYNLTAGLCTGATDYSDCVKVTATPVADDPQVGNLSMTSTGIKDCTGTAASTNMSLCWP
jgi:type IV pilus assembly protein PilE